MDPATESSSFARILDPIDRISEVLFGLIMVLGFTGSLSAAATGRADIRTMLFGAIGCSLAWGLIDAMMYIMACLNERGENLRTLRLVKGAPDASAAKARIQAALPQAIRPLIDDPELERIRQKVISMPTPLRGPRVKWSDLYGAATVFTLVVSSTLPVALPFVFLPEVASALRVSNLIAIIMLFLTGYGFGRCSELNPWMTGSAMVVLGGAMVGLTIALGG